MIKAKSPYSTHLHPLIAAVLKTKGNVIELGMGDFSTPVLHEICKSQSRKLISYENNQEWADNYLDMVTDFHEMVVVKDWGDVPVRRCGLLFVDHTPAERRIVDIQRFAGVADVIVVHDAEKTRYYRYDKIFGLFRHRHYYKRYTKQTMLLSKTIDTSKIV